MTAGERLRLNVLGRGVVIDSDDPAVVDAIQVAWLRCRSGDLPREDDLVLTASELRDLVQRDRLDGLATRLTSEGIKAGIGDKVMLHAAAMSDDSGAVLALVGSFGMGKTTAAVRLTRQILGYVTDEIVAVGPDGAVVPFPRPLCRARRPE